MSVGEVRKALMNAVLGLATAFITVGFLFENDELMVVGWIHAITYTLWLYGQTLHRP